MAKKKSNNVGLRKFSRFLWIISILFMIILGYFVYKSNVLPMKYFMSLVIGLVILLSIHGILILKRNTKKGALILLDIFALLFMSGEAFAICKINETISFLKNNLGAKYETSIYNIVVNKESSYNSLEDIIGLDVKTVKDLEDTSLLETAMKKKVSVNLLYENNIVNLLTEISTNKNLVIVVNSGNYDAMCDADETYESKVKVLDTVNVTVEKEDTSSNIDVTKTPFALYLSGIDTRSGTLPSRSLSDVNIILAVNPKTKHILMIHVPRDYYVQVHGTTGLKDKLTHTGTIGGVDLTMQTVEDLFEIKVPYYVRVNFNSVVNLVDAIGGININSDVNYSFSCWTDRSCTFNPGLNYVDGKCALAFARERHAYDSGDRHRGENQEQVISLVIDKVTSSSTLIGNYSSILNALNGTFETNLTTDDITSLVKMQIDHMSAWTTETLNVDGSGAYLPTYSYPNQNLYVMQPNMETVTKAVNRLNEVLETPNE